MEFENKIYFKDSEHLVTVKAGTDMLSVTVSEPQRVWQGVFSSNYIEDLTIKTGNTKTFAVFCKLLITAIQQKNPALHLDFYSYQDLESLRKGSKVLKPTSNKKYLIISYITDFEKVHYPLPLQLVEVTSNKNHEVSKPDAPSEHAKLKKENYALLAELNAFEEQFIYYRDRAEGKIEELTREKVELEGEIHRMRDQLDLIIEQLEKEAKKRDGMGTVRKAKAKLEKVRDENFALRSELNTCRKEISVLKKCEVSNKRLIDVLSNQIDSDRDIGSPLSAESPMQSINNSAVGNPLKQSSIDISDFNTKLANIKILLNKNKS